MTIEQVIKLIDEFAATLKAAVVQLDKQLVELNEELSERLSEKDDV